MSTFDLVVLGGGPGGYAAALRAAQLGLSVAMVEVDRIGGTCLHRGCIPTKALLQAAATAETVRGAADFGIMADLNGVDAAAIVDYADQVSHRLYTGLLGLMQDAGVHMVRGRGELLSSPRAVRVGSDILKAEAVVLATGSQPVTGGLHVDGERVINSDQALRLRELPKSAVVLGGGVIGVEFASAWTSLGVQVILLEASERLVSSEEPTISAALRNAFKRRGMDVRLGTKVLDLTATDFGVCAHVPGGTVTADLALVALGRKPRQVLAGGVEVQIGQDLHTNLPGVYAVGDLVPGPQLAHRGYLHGCYIAELVAHRCGRLDTPMPLPDETAIARITYSSPEIVSVGLTTEQARRLGEIETMDYNLSGNGRAQILAGRGRQGRGMVRVIRRRGGEILGIHIIGDHVSELAAEAMLIIGWEGDPEDQVGLIHPHPTLSEAIGEAVSALAGRPLHMSPPKAG